jgi:predicted HicB family RNase H-like nuclease
MNNTLEYKGYIAHVGFSSEDEVLVGRVMNTADRILFHGESIPEIKQRFEEVIDGYLANCAELGVEPNKPCNGLISLRISPQLQADIDRVAAIEGAQSRNEWIAGALKIAVQQARAKQSSHQSEVVVKRHVIVPVGADEPSIGLSSGTTSASFSLTPPSRMQ